MELYSRNRPYLTVNSIYQPSFDIDGFIDVTQSGLGLRGAAYIIYRIEEDVTHFRQSFHCIENTLAQTKAGLVGRSDNTADGSATIFTSGDWNRDLAASSGGTSLGRGYCFVSRDTVTAVNPGFDLEGDNDNVMEADQGSGTNNSGIELNFVVI